MRIPPRISQGIIVSALVSGHGVHAGDSRLDHRLRLEKGLPVVGWNFSPPTRGHGRTGRNFPTLVRRSLLPLIAVLIAVPFGVGTAVYLTEYTRESRATRIIRFRRGLPRRNSVHHFRPLRIHLLRTLLHMGWSLLSGD